jgi:hypothetical protein
MSAADQLLNAINQCGVKLLKLMHDTQVQLNDDVAAGNLHDAGVLRAKMQDISFTLGEVLNRQLTDIDTSQDMKKAIAAFSVLNKSITATLNELSNVNKFVTSLNSVLGDVNTALGLALKKPGAGGAGGTGGNKSGAAKSGNA